MPAYTPAEQKLFQKLNTPQKIQDYLNTLQFNFDKDVDNCQSPRMVMKTGKADCAEGAIFASAVIEFHGGVASVVDLRSTVKPWDYDHVIAVFKKDGHFGAISKTNHGVLRYREPVYKTVRELVMSYFHEYFLNNGHKTLREYSEPVDLSRFNLKKWQTSEKSIAFIPIYLDKVKHYKLLTPKQIKNLRKADKIEIEAGKLIEHKHKK